MPRVLIVDDNESARLTLSGLLRLEGYETTTACTGCDGITQALAEHADVILIDLHLPDVSGLDVVRTLKGHGVTAPMVIVTAFPDFETSVDAASIGAAGYVEGLLSSDELIDVLRQALSGRRPVRHPALSELALVPEVSLPPRVIRPRTQDQRLRHVVRAIDSELGGALSLSDLASRVRLSDSRLRHLFATSMGIPISDFIRERRLLQAARLLVTTAASVRTIATQLRLPRDLRAVRRAFRQRFGMSPRAYRNRFWRPSRGGA